MHPNPVFRKASEAQNLAFARQRGFGMLMIAGGSGPLVAHVPFLISADGKKLWMHLVRSNPVVRAFGAENPAIMPATMVVSGGDAYISPDWYGAENQVPTWNYVAVHLGGSLRRMPETELGRVVEGLSDRFEAELAPKPVWKTGKVDETALAKMMRQIAPLEMDIETIEGTWKLGQNKTEAARCRAAREVSATSPGLDPLAICALMRNPPC